MKINLDFIYKIFNLELKLKKDSDKKKLSLYEDMIPMYDIYSMKIYPINKMNLHHRLIESHYRFINEEIYSWLTMLYKKYKNDMILGPKYKYNIDVLSNYIITILIETSYKTLYKYSPKLGLQVSICKRNSFNPYIYHLKPYYTKLELIKLGQNMDLFKKKDTIELETLIDMDTHYKVCMEVSKNDVSFEEIKSHHLYIIDNNMISWVCFYSFIGSFLFNKFLRNVSQNLSKNNINDIFYNGLTKMINCMKDTPALTNDYDMYRFIWDDTFLINMNEGDIFIDTGFTSTTRDPFYSPGLNGNFGLILLKIKIPKGKKGVGLFIENFSLFPKEEEFLLPPGTKLKLISKNDNFKYYHTNMQFEKLINRKYEFELVTGGNIKLTHTREHTMDNKYHMINNININGTDRIDVIKQFVNNYSSDNKIINLQLGTIKYKFIYEWFDSTNNSSYEKFYYNKIKDGILFSIFDDNGYPYLNIELGNDMVINYLNTMYFCNSNIDNKDIDNNMLDLVYHFGRIFYYKTSIIFHKFSQFNNNNDKLFTQFSHFNNTIYDYLKHNKKYLDNMFTTYNLGYWYLDEYFSKKSDDNIMERIPQEHNIKTNKDLLILVIEKYFYLYPKIIELMDKNIFSNQYITFNIYDKLVVDGLVENFIPSISYANDDIMDDDFKLIFRQPIRRL